MSKVWAFVTRDFQIATSYRAAFAIQIVSLLLWVPICFFLGQGLSAGGGVVDVPRGVTGMPPHHGDDSFAFLLIGVGLLGYMTISLRTFGRSIRDSQLMGTLEIVLQSPTSIAELLFCSSAWIYLFATVRFALFLAFGLLFGLDLGRGNAVSAVAVLGLAIPAFAALGVAAAAVVLIIKRGESLYLILATASLLLGGVMFPTAALPAWLQPVAQLLPITHALEAMRLALIQGYTLAELGRELGLLALFAAVLLPLSLGLFWLAVRHTKATGTLAHY